MTAIDFTQDELSAFREEMFQGFTDSQFNLAIAECKRRNLVPGQHVYFQLRNSKEWNSDIGAQVSTKKLTKVTTIDAFRLISQRTGEYTGQGKAKFYYLDNDNTPSIVSEIPLPHPTLSNTPREPWACAVPIYRKGFVEPVEVVCRFDAYAVTRKSGQNTVLTDMWVRRGPEQLAKCSEAASRRVAFAEELGSMYLSEEFAREDAENKPEAPSPEPQPIIEAPKAVSVPTVNHTPATPTNEPRPGEEKPKPKKNAKDVKIEDVILDKVEIVSGVADDHLKIDKPASAVHVKIAPDSRAVPSEGTKSEPNTTVQKMEKVSPSDRARKLISDGVNRDNFKQYALKSSEVDDTKKITNLQWDEILNLLEGYYTEGGKDLTNAKINEYLNPPQTEEEVF